MLFQAIFYSILVSTSLANPLKDIEIFPRDGKNDRNNNCNVKAFNCLNNYGGPSFISSYCSAIIPTNKRWTQTATATTVITVYDHLDTKDTVEAR